MTPFKKFNIIDKSKYSDGPWMNEPDLELAIDNNSGFPMILRRADVGGQINGYVGVPKCHPLHGKHYSSCVLPTAKRKRKRLKITALRNLLLQIPRWLEKELAAMKYCKDGECCDHRPEHFLQVHGGITYSDYCHDIDSVKGYWFFGFDTAHCTDIMPGMEAMLRPIGSPRDKITSSALLGESYKNIEFVRQECADLARQLRDYRREK